MEKILLLGLLILTGIHATADGPDFYKIRNVARGDVLWMHPIASSKSRKTGAIPHNAVGLKSNGCIRKNSASYWCKITYNRESGWVNARYLAEDDTYYASLKKRTTIKKNPDSEKPSPYRITYSTRYGVSREEAKRNIIKNKIQDKVYAMQGMKISSTTKYFETVVLVRIADRPYRTEAEKEVGRQLRKTFEALGQAVRNGARR